MSPENKKGKGKKDPGKDAVDKLGLPEDKAVTAEPRNDVNSGEERRRRPAGRRENVRKDDGESSEYVEKVLTIKRVTKVTKGGKRLAFSALVVVGDGKGHVGYGLEKAGEVAAAIKKSLIHAKKNMVRVPMRGKTIPHDVLGCFGAARVLLKPASEGTGVIACGAVRAVCDGVGIHDILTKCHRSNNPINVVKATFEGLSQLKVFQPKDVEHANT